MCMYPTVHHNRPIETLQNYWQDQGPCNVFRDAAKFMLRNICSTAWSSDSCLCSEKTFAFTSEHHQGLVWIICLFCGDMVPTSKRPKLLTRGDWNGESYCFVLEAKEPENLANLVLDHDDSRSQSKSTKNQSSWTSFLIAGLSLFLSELDVRSETASLV